MPSNASVQRFGDIIEAIARIKRFTAGMDMRAFAENEQAIHAVKYALVIVSEAAVKLGDTAGALCPKIPWRDVRGLGNRLRHGYDTVDIVRIRLLPERDLPVPNAACKDALSKLSKGRQPGW